jgi:hypothetical protein
MKLSKRTLRALACFITGDSRDSICDVSPPFRYRTATELNWFFDEIGLEATVSGTRYFWVLDLLGELNDGPESAPELPPDALRKVIEQVAHRDQLGEGADWSAALQRINRELARDSLILVYTEEMVTPQLVSAGSPYVPGAETWLTVPFPRTEPVTPLVVRPRFHRRPAEAAATLGFVLMPFQSDFNDVLSESIRPAVEGNGLVCQRADDIENNDEIMEDVWEGIWKCRIVVADLTDDNPNVFYEVGIADTVGKEVVLIAQNGRLGRPPFDVSARRIVFYDNDVSGRKKLRKDLASMIAAVLEKSATR